MSFEYNGFVYRDLEPQVRYDAEQVELLKQADIKINERIDNIPLGAEKVSLTFPAGASEGTITNEQLATLQANEENYIEMVNDKELYYLNDPGHEEGFLTYSHVGIENSKATIKTLTITVSAKSFVIVTTVVPTESGGGGKLYVHKMEFRITSNSKVGRVRLSVPSSKNTSYTYTECLDNFSNWSYCYKFLISPSVDYITNAAYLASWGVPNKYSDNYVEMYIQSFDGSSQDYYGLNSEDESDYSDTVTEL